MNAVAKPLLALALVASSFGCHAQKPAAGTLSPELYRRVEILIRTRAKIPPNYLIHIGPRTPSDVPGYDSMEVSFTADGQQSKPVTFLLSNDGKTVAQFSKYDISANPLTVVSGTDRPARGGPQGAPVEIVGFDDLECPYCAKMHSQIFPALTQRYGDKVRFVYKDFPISQHPWAMRAAVDVNCVATQSSQGYWNLVDTIHAHAGELGGTDHNLQKALDSLDKMTLDEAAKEKLKQPEVEACIKKQDDTKIKASLKVGEDLNVEATPVLFINGEKFEGAYPLEDLYRFVDSALIAAGQTPPPPYVPPAAPATPSDNAPAPVTKPGS
ncbi:DsbA family protein [Granulicella tundricola]|uniref:Putative lipoprotein n=1 Tax=Granulicella tundricola (strain ATCC BAA-1859 / DSM 23138 / MP5ACTX9) TaxID=1198114 RepID=E8X5P8_GRATM|nr:thioredoxin domain-containing protein [Granulicella tundricola]ADW70675.1 putative lipoprotein [Granulicella tundricola MP5ACTX9]